MVRTKTIRDRLGWSQAQLADYLGLSQPAVARCEAGHSESGPVSRLLDQLELGVGTGILRAGMSAADVIRALSPSQTAADRDVEGAR
jgi:transcriptional regulator with XRE-family HTH domain